MSPTHTQLIFEAEQKMKKSFDILHNDTHAKRVVFFATTIGESLKISEIENQILILSAWWHDVGRTLSKKPSVFWMRCVDDIFSAIMLFRAAFQIKNFTAETKTAIKIILSKNFGLNLFLKKFLLSKRENLLLSILEDADALDVIHIERVNNMRLRAKQSKFEQFKYKCTVTWFLHSKEFHFHTKKGTEQFEILLNEFYQWLQKDDVLESHLFMFGKKWIDEKIKKSEEIILKMKKKHMLSSFNG